MRGASLGNHCSTVYSVLHFPSPLFGRRFFLEFCTSCHSACVGREAISDKYKFPFLFRFNSGFYCTELGFNTTEEYRRSECKPAGLKTCLLRK